MQPATTAEGRASMVPGALVFVAILVPGVLDGAYNGAGRDLPDGLPYLTSLLFVVSLWAWFWSYSRRHRIVWPMDMAVFLALLWIVIVPYYVLKTEGRRAWGLFAVYAVATLASWAVSVAISVWVRVLL